MSRIVVFGAGFLGHRFEKEVPGAVLSRADITDKKAVLSALREARADAVINCAGKTGRPNVDWCETHQSETYRANVIGALTLADACREADTYLMHLASGCIFYGERPGGGGWREDDHANPSGFYSRTKYAADLVLSRLPNVGIARLRMPIDDAPGDRNLITKLSRYPEVIDVENSVTVVSDLVAAVVKLVDQRATGVFHVVNPGRMRHRDLLALYREVVDPNHDFRLIRDEDLVARGLALASRSNCVLSSDRLAALGISLRPIEEALREVMTRYRDAVRR